VEHQAIVVRLGIHMPAYKAVPPEDEFSKTGLTIAHSGLRCLPFPCGSCGAKAPGE